MYERSASLEYAWYNVNVNKERERQHMTRFTKDNLRVQGSNLMYMQDGYSTPYTDCFVAAQFGRRPLNRYQPIWQLDHTGYEDFADFIRNNFTVDEYFTRMDAGEAPLTVVKSKGYLLPHVKTWLQEDGYPITSEGFKQMIEDQKTKMGNV